jgi:hypothetical protein
MYSDKFISVVWVEICQKKMGAKIYPKTFWPKWSFVKSIPGRLFDDDETFGVDAAAVVDDDDVGDASRRRRRRGFDLVHVGQVGGVLAGITVADQPEADAMISQVDLGKHSLTFT